MKESKQPRRSTEKKAVQAKSNNNLLIVLAVLVLIIIVLVIYAMSPGKTPSSLVEQSQQFSQVASASVDQEEPATVLAVVNTQPEPVKREPAASAASSPSPASANKASISAKEHVHTVKAGETLFNITQRYNIPQQEFRDLNHLADNTLKIGQQVKVKVTAIHQVQPGEGLKEIAEKYQVKKQLIMKANSLEEETLQLNQQLIIPLP